MVVDAGGGARRATGSPRWSRTLPTVVVVAVSLASALASVAWAEASVAWAEITVALRVGDVQRRQGLAGGDGLADETRRRR